jgi:hypothetical protein
MKATEDATERRTLLNCSQLSLLSLFSSGYQVLIVSGRQEVWLLSCTGSVTITVFIPLRGSLASNNSWGGGGGGGRVMVMVVTGVVVVLVVVVVVVVVLWWFY